MKVLLVENSGRLQNALESGLRAFGYEVDVVADASQAVEYASDKNYDIIILDLMLPRDSSLLVLHEIRESNREVEILILSAQDQIHDRVTALIQGATDYLVKPFTFTELHTRIQELLQNRIVSKNAEPQLPGSHASGNTNRLIKNLIDNCSCEHGPIELVISEIKSATLLQKVCEELKHSIAANDIQIRFPRGRLPALLIDVKLMQLLLVKLLANSVHRCPPGSEVNIGLNQAGDYCEITIESLPAQPLSSHELKKLFRDYRKRSQAGNNEGVVANLSLARNYAESMNLDLRAQVSPDGRFCVHLSNIRII